MLHSRGWFRAVEAVRSMGKIVWVCGYASQLQKGSLYNYVPDEFRDLERELERECEYAVNRGMFDADDGSTQIDAPPNPPANTT